MSKNITRKRSRSQKRSPNLSGIASNSNNNAFNSTFRVGSETNYSRLSKKQRETLEQSYNSNSRTYNKGLFFEKRAIRIPHYKYLDEGKEYLIGIGDHEFENHAYFYTGIFEHLDDDGNAIFKEYSQLSKNGKKYKHHTNTTIKPFENQRKNKRIIYKLVPIPDKKLPPNKKLPNVLSAHIRSFL